MPDLATVSIVLAWTVLVSMLRVHQWHLKAFQPDFREDRSMLHYFGLAASVIVGAAVGIALAVYLVTAVGLLVALAIWAVATVLGIVVVSALLVFVGVRPASALGFVAWPVAAIALYRLIGNLPR